VFVSVNVTLCPTGTCALVGVNVNSEAVTATFEVRLVGAVFVARPGAGAANVPERLIEPRINGLRAIAVTSTLRPPISKCDW
jgi:hypothetical protein